MKDKLIGYTHFTLDTARIASLVSISVFVVVFFLNKKNFKTNKKAKIEYQHRVLI